jgi:hypothetical protein
MFCNFEYRMFYVLYPFVTYLFTLPRKLRGLIMSQNNAERMDLLRLSGLAVTLSIKTPAILSFL